MWLSSIAPRESSRQCRSLCPDPCSCLQNRQGQARFALYRVVFSDTKQNQGGSFLFTTDNDAAHIFFNAYAKMIGVPYERLPANVSYVCPGYIPHTKYPKYNLRVESYSGRVCTPEAECNPVLHCHVTRLLYRVFTRGLRLVNYPPITSSPP